MRQDLSKSRSVRSWLAAAAVAVSGLVGVSAHAAPTLIGDVVNVRLVAPNFVDNSVVTPINVLDNVTVGAGREIQVGDGSNIGAQMLGDTTVGLFEFIDLDALTITLRLFGGDSNGPGTGLGAGAAYVFSGLNLAGGTLTGASFTVSSGVSNFAANWLTFTSPDTIRFALDTIAFVAGTGGVPAFGDVTITLAARDSGTDPNPDPNPVPEPGSLALAGLALCSLWCVRRRRAPRIG